MVTSPVMTTPLSSTRLTRSTSVCSSPGVEGSQKSTSSARRAASDDGSGCSGGIGIGEVVRGPGAGELEVEARRLEGAGELAQLPLEVREALVGDEEGAIEHEG